MTHTFHENTSQCLIDGCQEVYITKSNFEQIINRKNINVKESDLADIYDSSLSYIFSIPELRGLYAYREFLRTPALFMHAIDKYGPQDTKSWVWEGGKPAFHCNESCERLHSEFFNLEIPPEIQIQGENQIEKFRKFVKANQELLKRDESRFLNRLEAQFFLKNPPKEVSKSNSGVTCIENFDLESLTSSINKVLIESKNFQNRDAETNQIIKSKGYGTNRVQEAKFEGHPLFVWHQYKLELKRLLKSYYRAKYNKNFKFEASLLEQLGFKPCSCCN